MKRTKCFSLIMAVILAIGLPLTAMGLTDTTTDVFTITVDEVAEIAVQGAVTDFTVSTPGAGSEGDALSVTAADSATSLEYTSTIATGNTRDITAAVTSGDIPVGLNLNITSGAPGGTGTVGTLVALGQDFSNGDLTGGNIITGVGSCNTATSGPTLTYTLTVANIANVIVTTATSITVTYTLAEDGV